MSQSGYVHIDVERIVRETDKAFQVLLEGGELVWLPKSQIADADAYEVGDEDASMSITEYIAREKGIGE